MPFLWLFLWLGCADTVQNTLGVGAVYITHCSARMAVEGDEYRALCDPPPCADGFVSVGTNQEAVALDPGVKVIGNAGRICVQDLASSANQSSLTIDGKKVE